MALRLAQMPDDKARAAATAVADLERRQNRNSCLVGPAVLGMNAILVIPVAGRLFQFF